MIIIYIIKKRMKLGFKRLCDNTISQKLLRKMASVNNINFLVAYKQ